MRNLRPLAVALQSVLLAACASSPVQILQVEPPGTAQGPRVLCVVAHPDDEIAFGGTLFKIATHLDGTCDVLVITNGEGGYKYSTLGERLYGHRLTDPAVGRRQLPSIRQREMRDAAEILAIHELEFLNQQDHRYTQDPMEVLAPDAGIWDLELVRQRLHQRLTEDGGYDFVFVHLPTADTHGHHQAASRLALEAVAALPVAQRPVVLAASPTGRDEEDPELPEHLPGEPLTSLDRGAGSWVFDRTQSFGYRNRLDYRIVSNLAMAQHLSQGSYQTMVGRWSSETFRRFELEAPAAVARTDELFRRLAEPQWEPVFYDAAGNLTDADPEGEDAAGPSASRQTDASIEATARD